MGGQGQLLPKGFLKTERGGKGWARLVVKKSVGQRPLPCITRCGCSLGTELRTQVAPRAMVTGSPGHTRS